MPRGTITHVEFPADDPERAKRFYAAVAGGPARPPGNLLVHDQQPSNVGWP
jgi:hypothetical protein